MGCGLTSDLVLRTAARTVGRLRTSFAGFFFMEAAIAAAAAEVHSKNVDSETKHRNQENALIPSALMTRIASSLLVGAVLGRFLACRFLGIRRS